MKELYKKIILAGNFSTPASEKLFETARRFYGMDASPLDVATDDLACAESVNNVVFCAFGEQVGGGVSTTKLFDALLVSDKFAQVDIPKQGDIIISPTGYGKNKKMPHGHVGIVGANGIVMSNNSLTGKWDGHYNLGSWNKRYAVDGGYPVYYFRRIFL